MESDDKNNSRQRCKFQSYLQNPHIRQAPALKERSLLININMNFFALLVGFTNNSQGCSHSGCGQSPRVTVGQDLISIFNQGCAVQGNLITQIDIFTKNL